MNKQARKKQSHFSFTDVRYSMLFYSWLVWLWTITVFCHTRASYFSLKHSFSECQWCLIEWNKRKFDHFRARLFIRSSCIILLNKFENWLILASFFSSSSLSVCLVRMCLRTNSGPLNFFPLSGHSHLSLASSCVFAVINFSISVIIRCQLKLQNLQRSTRKRNRRLAERVHCLVPRARNSPPPALRLTSKSFFTFKKKLKSFLFGLSFCSWQHVH